MPTRLRSTALSAIADSAHTAVAPLAWNPTNHLLSRFTYGARAGERAQLSRIGPDAWWTSQVALGRRLSGYRGDSDVQALGPLLTRSAQEIHDLLRSAGRPYGQDALDQLARVTAGLQLQSPAQLYETVVDFFANHLNVTLYAEETWNTRHTLDRDVVRPNAFGSYSDMLLASSKNPAMLYYFNQSQSTKTAVNENYARELLELHTVGLNYSEADVRNSAAILTGRTVGPKWRYLYNPYVHATGPVSILGFHHDNQTAAGGEAAADAYVRYLARHPLTARNIARKLCLRFVSDHPSDDLVAAVAGVYLANDTAILPAIRAILCSVEFWESRGAKVRRPAENTLASMRTLGTKISGSATHFVDNLQATLAAMGSSPLNCGPATGYADQASSWRSSGNLMLQFNLHRQLGQNKYPGRAPVEMTTLFGPVTPKSSGNAIDLLATRLVGQVLNPVDKQTLLTYLGESENTRWATSTARTRLDGLVILLLDSPYHALR